MDGHPPQPLPLGFESLTSMVSVLYNGMLEPIAPLAITGAIWYQGESNTERAFQYRKLLPAMIADWRKLFGQGDFPFYIVSLPAYMHRKDSPGDDSWAEMREAQALTAKNGAVTRVSPLPIDTGDPDNIHPSTRRKSATAWAFAPWVSTTASKCRFPGRPSRRWSACRAALKLHFDHTDGGLVVKGDKLGEFSIAGDDRKWYWADARIEGDSVIVSSSPFPNQRLPATHGSRIR